MGKCEDRLRSGCELLRSGLAWMVEGYYLCSVDVGRAGPEKPNGKESKEKKDFFLTVSSISHDINDS